MFLFFQSVWIWVNWDHPVPPSPSLLWATKLPSMSSWWLRAVLKTADTMLHNQSLHKHRPLLISVSCRDVSEILQRTVVLILLSCTIRSAQCDWLISPLEIKLSTRHDTAAFPCYSHINSQMTRDWIKLSYSLPLSCCLISWVGFICCSLRGISVITALPLLSSLSAFRLPLPSLHSVSLLFVLSQSVSDCAAVMQERRKFAM